MLDELLGDGGFVTLAGRQCDKTEAALAGPRRRESSSKNRRDSDLNSGLDPLFRPQRLGARGTMENVDDRTLVIDVEL